MSEVMRLFILEDNERQITLYSDAIDDFKKKKNVEIDVTFFRSRDEALSAIKTDDFDAAILDLKLSGEDLDGQGNEVVREIKNNLRFPIFVLSGVLEELDGDLREQNIFYKIFNRTDKQVEEVLDEMLKIYSTGITKILGRRGIIENALHDVFWKHFADNKTFWGEEFVGDANCDKIFLRHILECLMGNLEAKCEEGLVYHHPVEVYIEPPIRSKFYTGDVLRKKTAEGGGDRDLFVILTPPCDLIQTKAKGVVLGFIEEPNMDYVTEQKALIEKVAKSSPSPEDIKKAEKAKQIIVQLVTNNNSLKYHYLPKCTSFRGGFINFQKIQSEKYSNLTDGYEVVVSIADSFVKDIIARFSHYYSRQGQPDFNVGKLVDDLLK